MGTPIRTLHWFYFAGLLVYLALALLGVMNVVTSVFVESAVMSAQHDRELVAQEKALQKEVAVSHMRELFHQMDVDKSGEITIEEMEYFVTEPSLGVYLESLGISADNTRQLFNLLDVDSRGQIGIEQFSTGCQRLQGEAKSMDVHILIYQVKQFLAKWSDFTEYVDQRFAAIGSELGLQSVTPARPSMHGLHSHSTADVEPMGSRRVSRNSFVRVSGQSMETRKSRKSRASVMFDAANVSI